MSSSSTRIVLNPELHAEHGWKRHDHYRFAANDTWAPLLLAELPAALALYALGFTARADGGYQLVVLLGLHEGDNLFLDAKGRWQGNYVPSHYRGYPFTSEQRTVDGQQESVFYFDLASGLYREQPELILGEERFFDADGRPGVTLQRLLTFQRQCEENHRLTARAVDVLDAAGLLMPWSIKIANPDPERPLLQGLQQINEAALNQLGRSALTRLRDASALPIAYAQIFSKPRLGMLPALYERRAKAAEQSKAKAAPAKIEGVLGQHGTEELVFHWDTGDGAKQS